jgi:hypothetical protein
MVLPQAIPVRYTEEDAGYVTFRPVVRQTFRLDQLLDMILSVTGKDTARIRVILKSGTVVFNFYRYWWEGLDVGDAELDSLLAQFPDPDPTRPFAAAACTLALAESGATPRGPTLELPRDTMSHKGLFQRRSFWDALLAAAAAGPLAYHAYSYAHHADLYRLDLTDNLRAQLTAAAASLAPRALRQGLRPLAQAAHISFVCPRGNKSSASPAPNPGTPS